MWPLPPFNCDTEGIMTCAQLQVPVNRTEQNISTQQLCQTCQIQSQLNAETTSSVSDISWVGSAEHSTANYLHQTFQLGVFPFVGAFIKNTSWTRNLCGYIGWTFFFYLSRRMLQYLNDLLPGELRCLCVILITMLKDQQLTLHCFM